MAMQHEAAIRRLKEIGQGRGYVTLDEVKAALPVETMPPEELGRVVLQLEEAGIEVQLDDDLLRPRPGGEESAPAPERLLPLDGAGEGSVATPPSARPASGVPFSPPPTPGTPGAAPGRSGPFLGRAMAMGGVLLALVVLFLLYAFSR
jgi:hypothetical protein